MARSLDDSHPRTSLVEVAHDFHRRGWMLGTSGNLSAREDQDHFWVTASGKPKGRLDEQDFLLVRIRDGEVVDSMNPDNRPSAETDIHRVIYTLFPKARACLHGHSVEACLSVRQAPLDAEEVALPPLEVIKGFNIWEQTPEVGLPLFENLLDVNLIALAVQQRFSVQPPAVSALMIRAHGPTVWGDSIQQAYDRFELLDFILRYQSAVSDQGGAVRRGSSG